MSRVVPPTDRVGQTMERVILMQVNVSGRKVTVGSKLQSHIVDRLEHTATKYFDSPIEAMVTLTKEGPLVRADCQVHAGPGINLQTHAEEPEPYGAFDKAADRLEKRLRRHKRRVKNRHAASHRTPGAKLPAQAFAGDQTEIDIDGAE